MGFAEVKTQKDSPSLVRKVLEAVAVLAPMAVDLPETLTDTNGVLQALPESWWGLGLVTPDGYTFGSETEKAEVDALGYSTAVRSDITKVAKTITVTALESDRRPLNELFYGVDLSAATQGANGEVVFDEPELPIGKEYRMLIIGKDGTVANEWLRGRGYPRVKLGEQPEEQWGGEDALQRELTFDVFTDEDLGTPVRHYLAGTGPKAFVDELDYTQAAEGGA